METVTQFRTGHNIMCPVVQSAALLKRLGENKNTTESTQINNSETKARRVAQVTDINMRKALRAAVFDIEEKKLGIKQEEIGTHSLRSGAVMTMHLAEIPVYTIMVMGRWSSDAFL